MGLEPKTDAPGRIVNAIRSDASTNEQSMSRIAAKASILINSLLDHPG